MSLFDPPVRMAGVLKKFPGASRSVLIQCTDGRYYVAKLLTRRAGNTLRNEAIGTYLMEDLRIPTPSARLLRLSKSEVKEIGNLDPIPETNLLVAEPGLHFASEYRVAEVGCEMWTGDYGRQHLISESDRVTMYLFDLWAEHHDSRQFVHIRDVGTGKTKTLFIDNGYLFRGTDPSFGECCDLKYRGLLRPDDRTNPELCAMVNVFRYRIAKALDVILRRIPSTWCIDNQSLFRLHLLHRLMRLSHIVDEDFAGRAFNPPPAEWGAFRPSMDTDLEAWYFPWQQRWNVEKCDTSKAIALESDSYGQRGHGVSPLDMESINVSNEDTGVAFA